MLTWLTPVTFISAVPAEPFGHRDWARYYRQASSVANLRRNSQYQSNTLAGPWRNMVNPITGVNQVSISKELCSHPAISSKAYRPIDCGSQSVPELCRFRHLAELVGFGALGGFAPYDNGSEIHPQHFAMNLPQKESDVPPEKCKKPPEKMLKGAISCL